MWAGSVCKQHVVELAGRLPHLHVVRVVRQRLPLGGQRLAEQPEVLGLEPQLLVGLVHQRGDPTDRGRVADDHRHPVPFRLGGGGHRLLELAAGLHGVVQRARDVHAPHGQPVGLGRRRQRPHRLRGGRHPLEPVGPGPGRIGQPGDEVGLEVRLTLPLAERLPRVHLQADPQPGRFGGGDGWAGGGGGKELAAAGHRSHPGRGQGRR